MDSRNLFETPGTFALIRLEYLAALGVSLTLAVMHYDEIRILPFIGLFLYIDLIGYIPGAIVAHNHPTGYIPKPFYVLYNTMHSLLTAGLVAGLWCLFIGPEWALLALPIHLFGDRALFGNTMKSFGYRFEPQEHPVYAAIKPLLDRPPRPGEPGFAASLPQPSPVGEDPHPSAAPDLDHAGRADRAGV